ncbi:MAG: LexA family transcriptional regulator [Paludibacteraceae bacterium]|jgi:transcriptional regulator with XRE-family HTH domain|nr:LexA family transcriptional regulator [Paludibacteraceae bacterium]
MADLSIIKPLLKERGIKIKDFCDELGLTEQGFAKLIRANSTKIETLELIAQKLNVPISTFFTEKHEAEILTNMHCVEVPIVPVYAYASFLHGHDDTEYMDSLPTMSVIIDRKYGKDGFLIFEVKGNSMDDGSKRALLDGDKILVKELDSDCCRTKLKTDDNFFVIIHRTDGIVVKQIVEHNVEEGIIRCHSINPSPEYHDFDIDLREVTRIFKVAAIVGRKFK